MDKSDVAAIEFLSVGDLVGQSVRYYWQNALMILQVLLAPAIGCTLGKIFMHWPWQIYKVIGIAPSVLMFFIGFGVLLYSIWILMLRQFALARIFFGDGTVKEDFRQGYQIIKSMQGRILGVFSLSAIASVGGALGWSVIIIVSAALARLHIFPLSFLVCLIILEFIAMFISIAAISIIYWFALYQMILENKSIDEVLAQSWSLTLHDFWRVLYFICLSTLVVGLLTWPLSIPVVIFSVVELFMQGDQGISSGNFAEQIALYTLKAPFYKLVFVQVWESLLNIVTWPIVYFGWALFYQDLKKRLLASDLQAKLESRLSGAG